MENSKKNLKIMSLCMFLCVLLSLVRIVTEFALGAYDFKNAPQGTEQAIWNATVIVILAVAALVVISQLFLGFKGLSVAKNPDNSGAHIIIAKIFLVITILAVIGSVVDLIQTKNFSGGIVELIDCLIDVAIYFYYIKYAKEVRKNA